MKKMRDNIYRCLFGIFFAMAAGSVAAQTAAPVAKLDTQSIFTIPENPKQGRDPFFPNSLRPYQGKSSTPITTSLKLIGVSGTANRRLAIINNHTFAVGDEGQVTTSEGKVSVLCDEITDHSATVEVNGQRIELILQDNQ
jgi:hypothetical protein